MRIRGSVVGALEAVGASRKRALSIEASPWPEKPSGRAVLAAIEGRRRQKLPIDFWGLSTGLHQDRALLRAGRFLFCTWDEAVLAGAELPALRSCAGSHPTAEVVASRG